MSDQENGKWRELRKAFEFAIEHGLLVPVMGIIFAIIFVCGVIKGAPIIPTAIVLAGFFVITLGMHIIYEVIRLRKNYGHLYKTMEVRREISQLWKDRE